MITIPSSWACVPIGNLCNLINGRAFKPSDWGKEGLPIVRIQNLNNPDQGFNYYSKSIEEKFLIDQGQLLFAWSGTPGTSFGAHIWNGGRAVLNQHIFKVEFDDYKINKKYFCYAINQKLNELIEKAHGGVGLRHVTKGKFEETEIAIPPLSEQKRIVAKIEELFSELDKGIESLKTAREQLKVYRQAVLKHAFEGKLTGRWREENKDKLESADQLLERIKHRREAQYQQQLKEWQLAVKARDAADKKAERPTKPKALEVLQSLTAEELLQLPAIKNEWVWAKIAEVFGVYVGSTPSRKQQNYWGGNIFWVSSGEVAFCRIAKTHETITQEGYLNASTEIHPPGTIMLAMIGEGKTRGQVAILDVDAAHNQNTAAIRVKDTECVPEYLYYFFVYQYEKTRTIGSGNNQKALNKDRVSNMSFPLAPVAEQIEVVREVESIFSILQNLESEIEANLQKSEALRQSILKKAFSGKLVAQDPNDEPASALLERIRAEKEAQKTESKKPKTKRNAA